MKNLKDVNETIDMLLKKNSDECRFGPGDIQSCDIIKKEACIPLAVKDQVMEKFSTVLKPEIDSYHTKNGSDHKVRTVFVSHQFEIDIGLVVDQLIVFVVPAVKLTDLCTNLF